MCSGHEPGEQGVADEPVDQRQDGYVQPDQEGGDQFDELPDRIETPTVDPGFSNLATRRNVGSRCITTVVRSIGGSLESSTMTTSVRPAVYSHVPAKSRRPSELVPAGSGEDTPAPSRCPGSTAYATSVLGPMAD